MMRSSKLPPGLYQARGLVKPFLCVQYVPATNCRVAPHGRSPFGIGIVIPILKREQTLAPHPLNATISPIARLCPSRFSRHASLWSASLNTGLRLSHFQFHPHLPDHSKLAPASPVAKAQHPCTPSGTGNFLVQTRHFSPTSLLLIFTESIFAQNKKRPLIYEKPLAQILLLSYSIPTA